MEKMKEKKKQHKNSWFLNWAQMRGLDTNLGISRMEDESDENQRKWLLKIRKERKREGKKKKSTKPSIRRSRREGNRVRKVLKSGQRRREPAVRMAAAENPRRRGCLARAPCQKPSYIGRVSGGPRTKRWLPLYPPNQAAWAPHAQQYPATEPTIDFITLQVDWTFAGRVEYKS